MGASRSKPPSQRQLRVGEEVRHALVRILGRGEIRDPSLREANVTVTQVEVSPDLQNATAFVVPLGGGHLDETVLGLNRAAGYLRGQLGREIQLRYTPRLAFAADRSFDQAGDIERLLHSPRVRRDLAQAGDPPQDPQDRAQDGASDDGA